MKRKYPSQRKATGTAACPICGKILKERGYVSHLRLQHKLKVTEVKQQITQVTEPITQVKEPITQVKEPITQVTKITQVVEKFNPIYPVYKCGNCGGSYQNFPLDSNFGYHCCQSCGWNRALAHK